MNNKIDEKLRNHLYVSKQQNIKELCKFYFQCDNSIGRLLQQDITSDSFDFNIERTDTNSTNTIFYNKKYNYIYPHGDSRTSLQTYLIDMRKRYQLFKAQSHYYFFIYRLDPFTKYKQLLHFEEFLEKNNYNLSNFVYIDSDNHGFLPTKIKTYTVNDNSESFFINNREMLIQKSNELKCAFVSRKYK